MKERIKLLIYLSLIIFITFIHNPIVYFIVFTVIALISINKFLFLIKKTIKSIFIFNFIISVSYAIYRIIIASIDWEYVLMINLRVILITYLTFYFIEICNIFIALSFSKNLSQAMIALFLTKSMYNAKALSEGMASRGFFYDKTK